MSKNVLCIDMIGCKENDRPMQHVGILHDFCKDVLVVPSFCVPWDA